MATQKSYHTVITFWKPNPLWLMGFSPLLEKDSDDEVDITLMPPDSPEIS